MASQLQLRRGTTAQHVPFIGAPAEVTVDTDKKTLVVHDGSTAGGFPVLSASGGTMTGPVSMGGSKITSLATPTAPTDATPKGYVDGLIAAATLADADYGDITVSGAATVWTIDNNAVTAAKIASGAVTDAKIANDAVTTAKILNANVTTAKIADGAITAAKIDPAAKIGGATGAGTDRVFYENDQTVNTNYTISTNKNAMSAGPITVASGVSVTVPNGSTWTIV